MKQIFVFLAACLMMAACENDAEFATRSTGSDLAQPDGIEVASESDTTVTLYYSGLMLEAYPQWAQMPSDINALYSIDIRLGIAATYLVGFDLYATTGPDCWLNR